jgi:hypothetical protein
LAVEPPVPTTESTCCDAPTAAANHGGWAAAIGADATATTAALPTAHKDSKIERIGSSSRQGSAGVK